MVGIISRILYNHLKIIITNYKAYKESLKEPCRNKVTCVSFGEIVGLCPRCQNVNSHRERLLTSLEECEKEWGEDLR